MTYSITHTTPTILLTLLGDKLILPNDINQTHTQLYVLPARLHTLDPSIDKPTVGLLITETQLEQLRKLIDRGIPNRMGPWITRPGLSNVLHEHSPGILYAVSPASIAELLDIPQEF